MTLGYPLCLMPKMHLLPVLFSWKSIFVCQHGPQSSTLWLEKEGPGTSAWVTFAEHGNIHSWEHKKKVFYLTFD